MKILVTNDDGRTSEGLQILASVLRTKHEVWIVAPSTDRSGVSHGITMNNPLQFRLEGECEFSCSGLPVDCSITGSQGIMPNLPDVIISGINRGANIGTDIVYSGTAAAARQASFVGIPGIALSMVSKTDEYIWEPLARFLLDNLSLLISLCKQDVFVNINAPSANSYKGARMTDISRRNYCDTIIMREGPDGCNYSFFQGGHVQTTGGENSDWQAVEDGYVSISRVLSQPVCVTLERNSVLDFKV